MKRFWTAATVEGGGIALDGRPVKTPYRNPLLLPTPALAAAVAAEWNDVGDMLDPRAMPLTGLANAAIDIVAPDPAAFRATLAPYAETDLLAYRADAPESLVATQAAQWDPLLAWARQRFDVHVEIVTGIIHRAQPPATVARLIEALAAYTPFHLAALSPLISIGGSLIAALALAERAFDPDPVWAAVNLDALWQEQRWGVDELALQARAAHRVDYDAAVRFLALLDQ
jgi:chaperone required for assembly of F1-ATPase